MDNNTMLANIEERQNVFLKKVYLWMALGLVVTAIAAVLPASSATMSRYIALNPFVTIVCCVLEIAFVFVLSRKIQTLSRGAAFGLFFGYSALTGITFSSLVLAYAGTNILPLSFITAAAVFGSASLYGAMTKRSIRGWGGWLMMGLIALIVVSVVNIFLGSSRLEMLISGAGVLIFAFLTAWDSQKIMEMNRSYGAQMTLEELDKISILGALDLYLDFVNIFLYLVRLFAASRSND